MLSDIPVFFCHQRVMGNFGGVKYAQMHTLDAFLGKRWATQVEIEGLALMWANKDAELPDGHDGAVAADATLLEDEKLFVDLPNSFAMYIEPRWRSTDFAGSGPLTEAEYGRLKAGVPEVMRLAPKSAAL